MRVSGLGARALARAFLPKAGVVFIVIFAMTFAPFSNVSFAATGVPKVLNYQGRLLNSSGTLLGGAGTQYCFKFSLYDDSVVGNGTKLWPTSAPSTMTATVKNGVFTVGIGDTNAGGDALDYNFQDNDTIFLNVEVAAKSGATCAPGDGAETFENLSPRQRIFASGYAINSGSVGGFTASQLIQLGFSTTSANYWKGQNNFFATSSADFWKDSINFFSTSSADFLASQRNYFSTTSSDFFVTQRNFFSTSSVDYWRSITDLFSTSSNDYFVSQRNFFSTTSADWWKTQNNFFSTTSADYLLSNYNKGFFFSTTSADAWKLTTNFFSTTSADFLATQRNFFSTSSANFFVSQTNLFSTTSNNYWKSVTDFFSTTSAEYFASQRDNFSTSSANYLLSTYDKGYFFSTTSAGYFITQNQGASFSTSSTDFWSTQRNFFSTSSVAYWKSITDLFSTTSADFLLSSYDKGFFFSTTSSDAWKLVTNFFSTTSVDFWQGTRNFFSTTSASYFVDSTTTVPKTYTANTFTATQTFTNASTTNLSASYASSTRGFFGSLSVGALNGVLRAAAGTVSTGLVNLASEVTGILAVSNGGTGWAQVATGAILYGNGTGSLATTTQGLPGQVLSMLNGVPTWTATTTYGSGLSYANGNVALDTSGEWSGTFDGQEGSYYLQNSFSTSSADFLATQRNFFSTSSTDYYIAQANLSAFSTTSADFWKDQRNFFSTTSADAWKLTNNFFSTTSADFLASQRSFFSTTSSDFFVTQRNFFSTTSTDYWKSITNFFSTTSAEYFASQRDNFSTTSANYFVSSSSTIPKTYTNNIFTGTNTFNGQTSLSNASSTNISVSGLASTSNLTISSITSGLLKTGPTGIVALAVPGTDYVSAVTGDWTGTFDGEEGSYYLANSFSTTSANYWKGQNSFFSTTSADYYISQANLSAFSTTSADYWKDQRSFFSTTSADYLLASYDKGFFFSSTSADAWKLTTNFFSTTSADFLSTQRNYFSTSSANYFVSQTNLFSTTSSNYWKSITDFFSTTSAEYFASQRDNFSTTSANYFVSSSSTIPKTYTDNTFGGLQTFANASSTNLSTVYASSTRGFFGSLSVGALNGVLRAAAGTISTGLVNLASEVSGVLAVANGGTGWANVASGALLYGNGSGALATTSSGTAGQVLSLLNGVPTWTATTTYGTGLTYANGNVTLDTSGNWTGILDGQEGSYYLANSFSTTSSDYLATQRNFFSTSSASYFLAQNQGASFSTTSTDFWATQRSFFSTSSVAYWKSVTDLFSTTSANYLLSTYDKGFFFSTTSANAWKLVTDFFSTTSADFWKSQNNFFSSTSAEYFASQRDNFSTTSANYFVSSSTTVPKTYTNNAFTGFQSFTNASTTNASTTNISATYASSTRGFFGSLSVGALTGVLRAAAGVVSSGLVNLASEVSGILAVSNGGTGWANLAAGAVLYGNGTGAVATTTTGLPGQVLALLNGVPTWTASTTLATISGTLGVANGGTGSTTLSGLLKGNGTSQVQTAIAGVDYQAPLSTAYPILLSGNTLSLAFGTTTSNSWSGTQTFNDIVVVDATTTSLFSTYFLANNGGFRILSATTSATLASTTAFGRFIAGNIISTSSATSTFAGAVGIGVATSSFKFSVIGSTSGATGATGTAVVAFSNMSNTLSSGTNVMRLNIRNGFGTACVTGTTCPRFIEYFAGVNSGNDTGGTGVGSLRLSTAGTGITQTSGAADFAEYMILNEPAAVGDVVSLNSSGQYQKAVAGQSLIGVISDNPAFVGNGNLEGQANAYVVGFAGVIETTVSDANGPIDAGDLLTAGSVPGVAVKLVNSGYALGQALESFGGPGSGTITVLVMPKFVDASIALESYGGSGGGITGYWSLATSTGKVSLASSTYSLLIESASTTNLSTIYASSTRAFFGSVSIGSLTGVLKAAAGSVTSGLVDLATEVTGILPVARGGTGWANFASGALLYGNGAGSLATTTSGAAGQVLALLNGVPTWTATTTFGSGLSYANGAVTLDTTGNWTGTFDGQEGSYYLANSFSTTSADFLATQRNFFSTTSTDYYISQANLSAFSTTSADFWRTQRNFFSTSSADFLATQRNFFSTTSADWWKTQNNFFSTTSADYLLASYNKGFFFSTTSADAWKLTTNFFSTTSADFLATQRNYFSTTSTNFFVSQTNLFSTTSNNYWKSVTDFFSTTSADYFASQRNFFSTTSADYLASQRNFFSTTSANYFVASSSTIPKTYTNNAFTGFQSFTNASTTNASTTNISVSGFASTSALVISNIANGSLLKVNASGAVLAAVAGTDFLNSTAGDWTGTFDGQEGSYYLANSFSTSSANFWKGQNNFFATSSADYWKLSNNFFSTTSADWWKTQNNFFSTTSADYLLASYNKGFFFSTTSADAWKLTTNFFSTTSADFLATQRNYFSTTSANFFVSQTNLFSTTSNNYWKSVTDFFSTTSADFFVAQRNFFSTSSANYWNSVTDTFSTTSAIFLLNSSTTIPKTYTNNAFTGFQSFTNASTTNASTTNISATYASSTRGFFGSISIGALNGVLRAAAGSVTAGLVDLASEVTGILAVNRGGTGWANVASGAILYGNGSGALATTTAGLPGQVLAMLNGAPTWTASTTFSGALAYANGNVTFSAPTNSALSIPYASSTVITSSLASTTNLVISSIASGSLLKTTAGGAVIAAVGGVDYANFGYLFNNGATSTTLTFSSGLLSSASTTIGNGTQAGGLTVSGGATTTGNAYFGGRIGMGTTSPWGLLSIQPNGIGTIPAFVIGSSSATYFVVNSGGRVGIGTSTPGSELSIQNVANFSSGTSTIYGSGGIDITGGCFSVDGVCVTGETAPSATNVVLSAVRTGNATTSWTVPTNLVYAVVELWGGGGGGGSSGSAAATTGGTGGTSSFAGVASSTGGTGGIGANGAAGTGGRPGIGIGGDINLTGGGGGGTSAQTSEFIAGAGGDSPRGGVGATSTVAAAITAGGNGGTFGGGGAGNNCTTTGRCGPGGGGGGYTQKVFTAAMLTGTTSVLVGVGPGGAGGAAATGGARGGNGGAGGYVIYEYTSENISSGNGSVNTGTTGQFAFYNVNGTSVSGTSEFFLNTGTNNLGVGSSTPWGKLSIQADGVSGPAFAVGSSSATFFVINNGGKIGVSSSTPFARFGIEMGSAFPYAFQVSNQGSSTPALAILGTSGNGRIGMGTSSPWAQLSIDGSAGVSNSPLVSVGSSSGTYFLINNGGRVGIGTSTPGSLFSIQSVANFSAATTSFSSTGGVSIASGCFAVAGNCLSLASLGGQISLASGVTGILPVANGGTGWANVQSGALVFGNGSGALSTTSAGLSGQVLALLDGVPTWTASTTFSSGLAYSNGNVVFSAPAAVALAIPYSSSTVITASLASTTNLTVSSAGGSTGCAQFSASGQLSNTGTPCGSGGGSSGFSFGAITFATSTAATSSSIWTQGVFFSSSTRAASQLPYASTTALSVSGNSFLGTVSSGIWNGTGITVPFGGTGQNTFTSSQLLYGAGSGALQTVATSTISNGTAISVTGAGSVIGSGLTVNFSAPVSSALSIPFASTTAISATNASTTNLQVSNAFFQGGMGDCSSEAGNVLYNSTTGKFSCGVDSGAGGGAVTSVSAGNSTMTVSPTSGDVLVSLNLSNANVWTGLQQFGNASTTLLSASTAYFGGTSTTTIDSVGNIAFGSNTADILLQNGVDQALNFGTSTSNTPILSLSTRSSLSGLVGIGTSSPWGKLSIEMGPINPAFVVSNNGSSTPAFLVEGTNDGGFVGVGTSSPWAQFSINPTADVGRSPVFAVGSSSATSFLISNSGKVGIGSSTPWARFSVSGASFGETADERNPLFVFSTSSVFGPGQRPVMFGFATTTGALNYERVAIGTTSTWGNAGIRDQFTVDGRIYSTWTYLQCEAAGTSFSQTVTAISPTGGRLCGDFGFALDADSSATPQTDAYPAFWRLIGGTAAGYASSEGGGIRTIGRIAPATSSPVMEARIRVPNLAPVATSSRYIVGFTNELHGDTDYSVLPTNGVFFAASSTDSDWKAIVRRNNGETRVPTGIATTSTTGFTRMRIELSSTTAIFLINGNVVASISPGQMPSSNFAPMVQVGHAGGTAGTVNVNIMDVAYIKVWIDDPPVGVEADGAPIGNVIEGPLDLIEGADVAENYLVDDPVKYVGGVLITNATTSERAMVGRSLGRYDENLMGVISTSPHTVMGAGNSKTVRVALSGRVPTIVSLENGVIQKGDRITSSSFIGIGMKASRPGQIVGRALESFGSGTSTPACDTDLRDELEEAGTPIPGGTCLSRILVLMEPGFDMGIGETMQDITSGLSSTSTLSLVGALGELFNGAFHRGAQLVKAVFGQVVAKIAIVGEVFAKAIHAEKIDSDSLTTKELCVADTCVGEAQFLQMVQAAAAGSTGGWSSSGSGSTGGSSDEVDLPATSTSTPIIEIQGNNPATIIVGTSYADLGAIIAGPSEDLNLGFDYFVDGVEVENVTIDTSVAGDYTITYRVTDSEGNVAEAARMVHVVESSQGEEGDVSPTPPATDPPASEPENGEDTPLADEPEQSDDPVASAGPAEALP